MTDLATDTPADVGQVDGDKGNEQPTWYNGVDDDTIGYIQNKKWDSPLKAIEAYRNLEKFQGVPADQIIKLPKEGEPMTPVYTRLGLPESPDKYTPIEGLDFQPEVLSRFDNKFHALGLNNNQRKELLSEYSAFENEILKDNQAAIEQEKAVQVDALKKEWGQHYDERLEVSKRAVRMMIPDESQRDSVMSAIENAVGPAVVAKMFANMADRIGEDKIHSSSESGERQFGYTKEQAANDRTTLMAEIKADPKRLNDFNNGKGSDVIKLERLNKILAGSI